MPEPVRPERHGHAQAVALIAACRDALAHPNSLPWTEIDEVVRGDFTRETLAALAMLSVLALRLIEDGVRLSADELLEVMAASAADGAFDEAV